MQAGHGAGKGYIENDVESQFQFAYPPGPERNKRRFDGPETPYMMFTAPTAASSGSLLAPVAASAVAHVALIAAFQGGPAQTESAKPALRHLVKSVSMVVPPITPSKPPPPQPEPQPEVTPPKPPPEPIQKTQPPPKERRVARRDRKPANKPQKRSPAPTKSEPSAPTEAAPTIAAGPGSMAVPMQASDQQVVAKADAPPTPPTPTHFDLGGYGDSLRRAMMHQREYPDEARDEELEGEVVVVIKVNRAGRLACPAKVTRSSGHDCLDKEALRMVAAAAPFAHLPNGYEGEDAEFTVPVRFELSDDEF